MAAVTVSRSEGRLIAVKQVAAERAGEIEREAELLKRLDHPGLVRFIDVVETAGGGRALHTEFVSSDTWATRPLDDPAERAAAMATLAATVADLHQLGVAHLQIAPTHVMHGVDDRPVLCGLTLAAEATAEHRHTDLVALADLCHNPALGRGALATKLSSLADEARAGTLSARELVRRLDLLTAKQPARSEPLRARGGGVRQSLKQRYRPKPLLTAGAVVAAVFAAFMLGARSQGTERFPAAAAPASHETPSGIDTTGPEHADTATGAEQADIATGPNHADTATGAEQADIATGPNHADTATGAEQADAAGVPPDGTGALADAMALNGSSPAIDRQEPVEAVSVTEAAAVLEHAGRRYAVGAVGDFVETGDWDCDGQRTAAIVRPSTGGVVLFDAWPGPGETISLPERWSVDSPTGAQAVAHGDCDLLRVYTTAGSRLFNPDAAP